MRHSSTSTEDTFCGQTDIRTGRQTFETQKMLGLAAKYGLSEDRELNFSLRVCGLCRGGPNQCFRHTSVAETCIQLLYAK